MGGGTRARRLAQRRRAARAGSASTSRSRTSSPWPSAEPTEQSTPAASRACSSSAATAASGGASSTSLREIPSAPTWSFPPRPWTSHVRWIAPEPARRRPLLVGIELGGVMRSDDGGATWSDHRPGAQPDCHSLAWHPDVPGRAYEAGGGGAAWSFDGGETWEAADAGRDRHYTWAVAVDPDDPDCWFVSASTGPYAAHGRGSAEALRLPLARQPARGSSLAEGLPQPLDEMPYALAFADGFLAAGLADGTSTRAQTPATPGSKYDSLGSRRSGSSPSPRRLANPPRLGRPARTARSRPRRRRGPGTEPRGRASWTRCRAAARPRGCALSSRQR